MLSPCKNCERRKVGCHNVDTCPEWLEYVKTKQEAKAKRDDYREEQATRTAHLKRRGYTPSMR